MCALQDFDVERDFPTALLISHSNHEVFQLDNLFIKISSNEYPKLQGLQNEAKMMEALERPHKFIVPNILVTEDLGSSLQKEAFTIPLLEAIIIEAKKIHRIEVPVPLEVITRKELLEYRITTMKKNKLYEEAKPFWEKLLSLSSTFPPHNLVHGDLHLQNLVIKGNSVHLIDLESAHYSVAEWDWATLWLALTLEKFPVSYLKRVEAEVTNDTLFKAALYTKLAMMLTWSVANNDAAGVRHRLDTAKSLLKNSFVFPISDEHP